MRNAQGGVAGAAEAREFIQAFRKKGTRPWYGWTEPVGLPYEDPSKRGGPRTADEVDWGGF